MTIPMPMYMPTTTPTPTPTPTSTATSNSTSTFRQCHDHHKHFGSVSRARPLWHQISDARTVMGIFISALVNVFDSILIDLTHRIWAGYDSVFLIWFNSRLTHYPLFVSHHLSPIQSVFRESRINQGVFEITQHWNLQIFHIYDNLNIFFITTL